MSRNIVLRAASRLTFRMLLHQVKRHVRNRLVPRVPGLYNGLTRWRVSRTAELPPAPTLAPKLAELIHRFYATSASEQADALAGAFTFYGRRVDFDSVEQIDWMHRLPEERDHHLWRMKLCQLEVLHSILVDGTVEDRRRAMDLLESFEAHRGFTNTEAFGTIWSPYGASHRILALLSGVALDARRSVGGSDALIERVLRLLREDAAFVWSNVEHDLRNNHTERNLAALCLYASAAGISRRRARRLDRDVRSIIEATVLPDGMQIERSAMYQGLTVMSLRIFAETEALSDETRDLAERRVEAAEDAWLFLSHPDGDIALFNDSWIGETPRPSDVLDRPRPEIEALEQGGYFRQHAGPVESLMDVGAIGPRWNPGHGHADFLALEVDVEGNRLVVDPGTSRYYTGEVRSYERSAASHNGPHFIGVEPVEYEGCFKVGRLNEAAPVHLVRAAHGADVRSGRLSTTAGAVTRTVHASGEGVVIVDSWSTMAAAKVRILIDGAWDPTPRGSAFFLTNGSASCELTAIRGTLSAPAKREWSRQFLRQEPAWEFELRPVASGTGQVAVWVIGRPAQDDLEMVLHSLDATAG